MKTAVECIPCLITQGINISKHNNVNEENTEKLIKEILLTLSTENFSNSTPPHLVKLIYKISRKYTGNIDPYKDIKREYNDLILKMVPRLQQLIDQSENPLDEAIKLAVTGNIIDFGTSHTITEELIYEKINEVEKTSFSVDAKKSLYKKLESAKTLLYLGDNCGEIVFDKLLIKEIKKSYPHVKITFVVRGGFVLNDVTLDDATQVSMQDEVIVIDNGDNASGTIIENCNEAFVEEFYSADLIISKGQGNYETLSEANRKAIFFLFMTKCQHITTALNVPMFSLMCKEI